MKITKQDLNEILSNYNLGEFKKFGKVMKDDVVSYGQIIQTTKKTIFLKIFRAFDTNIKQGLFVSAELHKKGFPTYETYETKDRKKVLNYNGNRIALLEYVHIGKITEWANLTKEQIF